MTVAFRTTSSTLRCSVYRPLSRPIAVVAFWAGALLSGPSGAATGSRSTLSGNCFSGCIGEAGGAVATCAPDGAGRLKSRKVGRRHSHLLQGRIVSGTGVNGELG